MNNNEDVKLLDDFVLKYQDFKDEISKVIVGQDKIIKQVLISIFCNGHCLLVGVPGLAKTLLVQTISENGMLTSCLRSYEYAVIFPDKTLIK